MSNESFPFSTHKIINIAGHKLRALRLTFVGEMGWELHIPKESCAPVYAAVMQHGRQFDICDAGIVFCRKESTIRQKQYFILIVFNRLMSFRIDENENSKSNRCSRSLKSTYYCGIVD